MITIARTEDEINDTINKCAAGEDGMEPNRYPGMTFEQGVDAGIRWLLGWTDDEPIEDE